MVSQSARERASVTAIFKPSTSCILLRFPILKPGLYTIQQKSNGRFVDAHELRGKDFARDPDGPEQRH